MTTTTSDEQLAVAARAERSRTLAKLYEEMGRSAPCRSCLFEHSENSQICPKAIWQQAARMALQMTQE